MRMYFFVNGERVQNVGLRAKFLLLMHSMGVVGFADNVATGKTVAIRCWGQKPRLKNFYDLVEEKKPKNTCLSQPFFDNEKMPRKLNEMGELMYFQLEQLDRFIGVGKELREEIIEMKKQLFGINKNIKTGFEKVVAAVKS